MRAMSPIKETTMTSTISELSAVETTQVVSVEPTSVPEGMQLISWARRSTEKTPVKDTERFRGILVPVTNLRVPQDACISKFYKLLQQTVYELADAKFKAWVSDDRMHETQCPAALFNLDSVLAYWAEERQRQSIDGEKISLWLKESATFAALSAQAREVWKRQLPKMAAPAYRNIFNKGQCASIISKIADADLEHKVVAFIVTRCNAIISTPSEAESFD
jgi:hypothetical protein